MANYAKKKENKCVAFEAILLAFSEKQTRTHFVPSPVHLAPQNKVSYTTLKLCKSYFGRCLNLWTPQASSPTRATLGMSVGGNLVVMRGKESGDPNHRPITRASPHHSNSTQTPACTLVKAEDGCGLALQEVTRSFCISSLPVVRQRSIRGSKKSRLVLLPSPPPPSARLARLAWSRG